MQNTKKKVPVYLEPEILLEVDASLGAANATSRSDFIRTATAFYLGYLRQNKTVNYLAPLLADALKSEVRSLEKNTSEMIFKLAVELSVANNLICAMNNFDPDSIIRLRNSCAREVARLNGIVDLDTANAWQNGD